MDRKTRFKIVLERLMKVRGIESFRELSRRSGVQPMSFTFYFQGRQRPRIRATIAIATALRVPQCLIAWFAHFEEPKQETPAFVKEADGLMLQWIEDLERSSV